MASRRKKRQEPFLEDLSPQARQAIGAVGMGALGIFFVLSSFGDGSMAGPAGRITHTVLKYLFGVGFILAPIVCGLYVFALMRPRENGTLNTLRVIGIFTLFLATLGLLALYEKATGGLGGAIVLVPLAWLFGNMAAGIILGALALIGFFLIFNTGIRFPRLFKKKEPVIPEDDEDIENLAIPEESGSDDTDEDEDRESDDADEEPPAKKTLPERMGLGKIGKEAFKVSNFSGPYAPPPLSLLERDKGKARVGDVKANANIIKRTMQNFNIQVEMDEVSVGPSVTRYALKPAEGVRISKIVGLQNNLELALAAHPVRIEAPIPGKSLVGIEVPNTSKSTVGMASLLSSPEYTDSPKPLLATLGKDITGVTHFANIAKMPHLLIAGTTGSGKSVMIHTLITSLLFRNSPEQLRFIMIDPKRVELTLYNGIPHLLTPVITDAKKAILSLRWAAKEMERRYEILQTEKVRDISSYHENIYGPARDEYEAKKPGTDGAESEDEEQLPEPLPYIVIIIDELADIMQAYPRELESSIVRLAQMSRAVGIHLILSTQRPSVNVITGLIKANVPARIALQVASQIDSRTILDMAGAEKLLGAGDMLFLSGELSKPLRIQSAYISEGELKRVTSYLKSQASAQTLDSLDLNDTKENTDAFFESVTEDEGDDDLYEEARNIVVGAGKASTSYLQRRLRIGYSRAARLMDLLEERGVIGAQDGSRPREILGQSGGGNTESDEL